MGLPDFYETTYENDYYGMGNWDIMCSGSYNNDGYTPIGYNSYEKEFMGWHTPSTPVENHLYTLPKWNTGNDVSYKVTSPLNSNECYYLENRVKSGWDAYIKDEGMLVLHLTYIASRWSANTPNNQAIQLFTVIPADNELSTSNETKDCFGETNHELSDTSTPAAQLNMTASGSLASGGAGYMGQPLTEININSSDKSVSFWYMRGETDPLDAPALNTATDVTSSGFTASWSSVANAATYELQINPVEGSSTALLTEDFTSSTSWTTSGYTNNDSGYTRLGSSNRTGSVTSPSFDSSAGTITVKVTARAYNTDTNVSMTISLGSASRNFTLTSSDAEYTAVFTGITSSSSTVTIASVSSGKRVWLSSASIYSGDASSSAPRRATATSRTITGITGTTYNVTDLVDDTDYTFKVRAIPATSDEEHSMSDWSNTESVHTLYDTANHQPIIVADETAEFAAYVGQSSTSEITVLYENLTADISVNITGTDAGMFSCPSTITRDSSNQATLTVTYNPTAAGTHTATLTLSSTGADDVTVTLSGNATAAPLVTATPVLDDASAVTTESFKASWTDGSEAGAVASYTLYVNKKSVAGESDIFALVTDAADLADGDKIIIVDGTAGKAAAGFNGTYLSPASVDIENDQIDIAGTDVSVFTLEGSSSAWHFKFSDGSYLRATANKSLSSSTSATDITVSIVSEKATITTGSYGRILYNVASPRFVNYTTSTTVSSTMRLPQIYKMVTSSNAPRRVSTGGNADDGGLTVTGITGTEYTVNNLTPGNTYEFKVKAIYNSNADKSESEWSTVKEVTLPTGPTLRVSESLIAFDNVTVGATITRTFTVTGANLTGEVGVAISGDNVLTVSPTTITAAAATSGATVTVTYSPTAPGDHSATVTLSSTGAESVTVAVSGTAALEKAVPELTEAQAVTSSSFRAVWTDATPAANVASYTLYINKTADPNTGGGGSTSTIYDVLNNANTVNNTTNTYSEWTHSGTSGASYSGQSAGGNTTIQLRSNNSNSGIVTTGSGGKIKKVTVTWQSSTTSGRTLNVYGSNSAYTAPTDLYTDPNRGTLLGTIVYETSTELTIEGDYAYVGVCSASGAMYLTDITFTWEQTATSSAPHRTAVEHGDADDGGLTVTGITAKEYNVTELTAGATYEFKVKAVYTDNDESEWSNIESVTLHESTDPKLTVSEAAVTFTVTTIGETATQTFTVTGANLTDDVYVGITGDEVLTVSPASITAEAAMASGGATVTVTYSPTALATNTATITLSSTGAPDVTVAVEGTSALEKHTPVMAEAQAVTSSSFKAVWTDATPAANVASYTLYVNKTADPNTGGGGSTYKLLLDEDCSNTSTTWTTTNAYTDETGYVRLGAKSAVGSMTSGNIDLTDYDGKVTVVVVAKQYSSDNNVQMKITVGSATETFTGITTEKTYIAVLDANAGNNTVKIENLASKQRLLVKSVKVYGGDASELYPEETSNAPRRTAVEDGDADDGGLTVTGITAKEYNVTELTAGATYEFKVKAVYTDNDESEWSDIEEVTLSEGTTLAEVLDSPSGEFTVTDDLIVVAAIPTHHMFYATNGSEWLPIESETVLTEGQTIHNISGEFNGSMTSPLMEMTSSEDSNADVTYNIATYYMGDDFTGTPFRWEEMPAAGQVIDVVGYFFTENGVPTLRGYSGANGTKGRSLTLAGDYYGAFNYSDGQYVKMRVCIELKQQWSGARRRISMSDDDSYTNLKGQVITVSDVFTGIDELTAGSTPVSVHYVNAAGAVSDEPYDGLNIVVTTWSNGACTAVKVIK